MMCFVLAKLIQAEYKQWLDTTGVIPEGTTYYAECLGCAIDSAETLYNVAGYRKTFTSDLVNDTQKAYKEGYEKAQSELKTEIERLKDDYAKLQELFAQYQMASDKEIIAQKEEAKKRFENNMRAVLKIEKKQAVKEFAEKVKGKSEMFLVAKDNGVYGEKPYVSIEEIDELLKEYEK